MKAETKRAGWLAAIGLLLALEPAGVRADTFTWNAAAAGNASTQNNWLQNGGAPARLPASGDDIILNGTSTNGMTWDAGVNGLSDTVASWTQTNYTGTVTFRTVYGASGFTNFTVTGDGVVSNGVLTHTANTSSEQYRLRLSVGGRLTVGPSARIDASARGYAGWGAAGVGGHGGRSAATQNTYGSCLEPTNLGSKPNGGDGYGGGAVYLTVGGEARLDGQILATGGANGVTGHGGSIYLRAGSLSGSGTNSVRGGELAGLNGVGGGGGRLAVILTNSDDFASVVNTARGGIRYSGQSDDASAGTVYLEGKSQSGGRGRLIIDNNSPTYMTMATDIYGSHPTLTVSNDLSRVTLIVTNKGVAALTNFNVTVGDLWVSANSRLNLNGRTLTVNAAQHAIAGTVVSNGGQIVWITPGLYVDDTAVREGGSGTTTNASFRIRVVKVDGAVSFDYYTTNDTAEAGSDFVSASGSVTIPAWVTQTNLTVTVNGDDLIELDESFRLVVTNVAGAAVQKAEGACTITNDDARTLSIAATVTVNPEGASGVDTAAVFAVTLSQAIGTDVTFLYDTQDGTATEPGDYTAVSGGSGTIKAGTTQTNVIIVVKGDDTAEGLSEDFRAVLSSPSANATLGIATGICTIVDDEGLPKLSVSDVSVVEGNTGVTNAVFVLSMNKTSASAVTFDYGTADGTASAAAGDYTVTTDSGEIPAGALQATVTVAVAGDYWIETNETFELRVTSLANADPFDTNGVCTIDNDDYVYYWTGAGGNGLASATNNWRVNGVTAKRLPVWADVIVLDATSSSNLTWDAGSNGLSAAVGSWTQSNYTGVVTFRTVYGATGFTNFTVNGNAEIRGGSWTHVQNGGSQTYRLCVTVTGDLLVTNATINAMGCGYSAGSGPGAGASGTSQGGAHGGMSGYGNAKVYGSITTPEDLGSGGGNGGADSRGGGAIKLTVTGTATLQAGSVLDAQAYTSGGGAGGAGGSVLLTTGRLTGNGTIRAHGRNGSAASSGSGGRIAIVLTGAGADFSTWSGTNQAFGGVIPVGGAGTVYRRTAAGVSELIIDNNNATDQEASAFNWGPFGHISTLMPSDVNLNGFSNVVIRNNGVLGIKGDTTVDFGTFAPTVTNKSFISINTDTNVTYPSDWTIAGYTLFPNAIDTGRLVNITIETNGAISPIKGSAAGINLSIPGNLTVKGKIDADGRGYAPQRQGSGKGIGSNPYTGAAYGGGSLSGTTLLNTNTYGSILAPVDRGSSGEHGSGGGLILLNVAGTTTVASAGMISANAWGHNYDSQGSGGSVNLRTGWLTGSGTIRANGTTSWSSGSGGGGRVAIVLTGAGADFSTWTGTNTASGGGAGGGGGYQAAAGTVYRQAAGDAAGAGTVIVNNGSTATNRTTTSLPAFLNKSENLKLTSWMTTNTVRLGLTTNSTIASLTLNANGALELSGWTLTTRALTVTNKVYKSGIYTPSDIGALKDAVGGGQVVVKGAAGTVIVIR